MPVAVNRHPLPFLPALDRGHVTVQVGRDLFPRIQPILGRSHRWRWVGKRFAHRALLSGEHLKTDIFFLGATREPGEPADFQGPTVWYSWQAPETGYLHLDVPGYASPGVYLFTGNDLATLDHRQPVGAAIGKTFEVQSGQTYGIAVVSISPNPDGTFTPVQMTLDFYRPSPNDLFSARYPIQGDYVEVRGVTAGAQQQPGEPSAVVWWTWAAPAQGLATLELIDPLASHWAGAYTGTSSANLQPAGQVPHPQYPVSFPVEGGVQYHIAAYSGDHDRIAFRISLQRSITTDGLVHNETFNQGDSLIFWH